MKKASSVFEYDSIDDMFDHVFGTTPYHVVIYLSAFINLKQYRKTINSLHKKEHPPKVSVVFMEPDDKFIKARYGMVENLLDELKKYSQVIPVDVEENHMAHAQFSGDTIRIPLCHETDIYETGHIPKYKTLAIRFNRKKDMEFQKTNAAVIMYKLLMKSTLSPESLTIKKFVVEYQ